MRILLLVMFLVSIIVVSGCVEQFTSIGTKSIGDLSKNPEKYYNKTITIKGTLGYYTPNFHISGLNLEHKLENDEGYFFPIRLTGDRNYYTLNEYSLTGVIDYIEVCVCQEKIVCDDGQDSGWKDIDILDNKRATELCEQNTERGYYCIRGALTQIGGTKYYRCNSDSLSKIYYLDTTKKMVSNKSTVKPTFTSTIEDTSNPNQQTLSGYPPPDAPVVP